MSKQKAIGTLANLQSTQPVPETTERFLEIQKQRINE